MKVGFTGTREGMTRNQRLALHKALDELTMGFLTIEEFHHGDCVGADEQADEIAWSYTDKIVIHPPIKDDLRAYCIHEVGGVEILEPKEYLERDRAIVDACDILIAAPKSKKREKSGTWYTINYAKKQGKKVIGLEP